MKRKVGQVNREERDLILKLHERKNGLAELAKVITADNSELYEKLVADMGETARRYQQWWDDMADKYHWEGEANQSWEIQFDTGEVYLKQ